MYSGAVVSLDFVQPHQLGEQILPAERLTPIHVGLLMAQLQTLHVAAWTVSNAAGDMSFTDALTFGGWTWASRRANP